MNSEKIALYKALRERLFWGSIVLFLALVALSFFWSYAAPLAVVTLVWFALGIRIVPTQERWVIKMFDDPYTTAESGLRWMPFLCSSASAFPTTPVQLDFPEKVLIITKPGEVDKQEYGTMTLEGVVSFMFRYPTGDGLLKAAKILPNPKSKEAFIDYFQEPVFEEVRTIGGDFVYVDLLRRKGEFAEQVTAALVLKEGVIKSLMDEAGIVGPQVLIKRMDPPASILTALPAEEDARLNGRATRVTADAEADRERALGKGRGDSKRSEGAGVRDAKKMLYDLVLEDPKNIATLAMFTMQEMAQGPATTIFPISTDLMSDFRDIMGRQSPSSREVAGVLESLPEGLRNELTRLIVAQLKPKTPTGAE